MFIRSRNIFLNEAKIEKLLLEKTLSYSTEFINFLIANASNQLITDIVKHTNSDEYNADFDYIDINPKTNDEVIFVQGSKLKNMPSYVDYTEPYSNSSMKIGRFLRKLYKTVTCKNPIDKDIETVVNLFKSYIDSKYKNLEIVDGEKIRECYLDLNYS